MKRYRIVQTRLIKENKDQTLLLDFEDKNGYHDFTNQDLSINGWVFDKVKEISLLKVYLSSGGKRLLREFKEFSASPGLKEKFPDYACKQAGLSINIAYNDIAPLLSSNDFSLNFVANVNNTDYYLENFCFIEDNNSSKPIFIMGSARSGTSILTYSINKALGLRHYGEGHFLGILPKIIPTIGSYFTAAQSTEMPGTIIHEVDHHVLVAQTQQMIKKQYQDFFGNNCFVDKTPDIPMLTALPYIKQTWPQAKFIFAKRRGIENIVSRLQKFPNLPFEKQCQAWRDSFHYWQQSLKESKLQEKQCIEIDQYDIQTQPTSVAKTLGHFLDLEATQVKSIEQIFKQENPQMTRSNAKEKVKSINEVGWTKEQIKYFKSTCGDVMERFGYSENEQYYLKP